MRPEFFAPKNENWEDRYGAWYRHRASVVRLSLGDQGIPDGFHLTAKCGVTTTSATLDFDLEHRDEHCPECFPSVSTERSPDC